MGVPQNHPATLKPCGKPMVWGNHILGTPPYLCTILDVLSGVTSLGPGSLSQKPRSEGVGHQRCWSCWDIFWYFRNLIYSIISTHQSFLHLFWDNLDTLWHLRCWKPQSHGRQFYVASCCAGSPSPLASNLAFSSLLQAAPCHIPFSAEALH